MKKGFTLVELIGVITLLGLLAILVTPPIINQIKMNKQKIDSVTEQLIYSTVDLYIDNMKDDFPRINNSVYCIEINELVNSGQLSHQLLGDIDLNSYVKVDVANNQYIYSFSNSCETIVNQKTINLNGEQTVYVEVNTPYTELGATAVNAQNEDISSQIVISIDGGRSAVDTTSIGSRYIISYTVTDNGQTFSANRTVIVRDTTPPEITIPSNTTITTETTTFDVMAGVSATDNSGEAIQVTASGNLSIGVPGTYTITYTAIDSSNNEIDLTRFIIITGTDYVTPSLDIAPPELKTGMIAVNIANNGTVTKADTGGVWYDYANKQWANAVTVSSATRNTYMNAAPGTTIQANDILTYLVWIPRYKYELWNVNTYNPQKRVHSIDIVFENKNTEKSLGTTNGTYLTHPAFTFGEEELNGIWVGKFETGRNSTGETNSEKVLIKPNVESWRGMNLVNDFNAIKGMNGENNVFGLSTDSDTHMMKNIEWGAVAYLSHSAYGKNGKVYSNNQNDYITGCGGNTANDHDTSSCDNAYGSKSDGIYNQSTTGNISGIFDMSGGTWEYVMGYTTSKSSCQGGYGDCSGFTSNTFPEDKYVDKYNSNYYSQYNKRILGDATGETGPFDDWYSTGSWYSNDAVFVDSSYPWFARGGENDDDAGLFAFEYYHGAAHSFYECTFRAVIV